MQVFFVVVLSGWIALALLSENVDDDRSLGREILGIAQSDLELAHIMPVDGADVSNAERLEERRRLKEFTNGGLHRLHTLLSLLTNHGEVLQPRFQPSLTLYVQRIHSDARETVRELFGDALGSAERSEGCGRSASTRAL